jgi:hypothetical protein
MHYVVMTIGFEQTTLFVYEDTGAVSVCVKILRPVDPTTAIEDLLYSVTLTTKHTPGPNSKF